MKTLITPAEVSALCFGGDSNITAGFITDSVIIAAQRKYVFPVLGEGLWAAIEQERYARLVSDYIKPALALYVKYLVLPSISSQTGMLGVVRYGGQNFSGADSQNFVRLLKSVKTEADALLKVCSEHIESSNAAYPEYNPEQNVLNSVAITGGVVIR